jgi:hypothetical protein
MSAGEGEQGGLPDLTWAALLARWTAFAQASAAWPKTGVNARWRAATPAIIGLQAVAMALKEAHGLSPSERALGVARAGVVVARHERELLALWEGEALHPELAALLADAKVAVEGARGA